MNSHSIQGGVVLLLDASCYRNSDNSACVNREDICLQTLPLLFKHANHKNKRSFVSTANEALVGALITIGDINNVFPIKAIHIIQEKA